MIRVLVADDHAIVREGVVRLLRDSGDLEVVAEAASGPDLLAALRRVATDIVLLDVSMPGARFVEVLAEVRRSHPSVRIVVLSAHAEEEYAVRALKGGAAGYVAKERSAEELVDALRLVAAGRRYVTASVGQLLASAVAEGTARSDDLSDREREVLALIGRGRSVKEVAAELGVSVKTVSTYRSRLLSKLGLKTTADLIRHAMSGEPR